MGQYLRASSLAITLIGIFDCLIMIIDMALHTTMYILLVILAPVIHSTAETRELVLKESGELCQKSNECSSGRCVPDFSQVKPIKLGFHGVIHHLIIRKCAVCTISSQCQKNQYCSKFKCHNNYKQTTTTTTTTAKPTPDEPSLATLLQLLTKLTQNQQKRHKQLVEKQEQLHQLLNQFGARNAIVNVGNDVKVQNVDNDVEFQNVDSEIDVQCGGNATCEVNYGINSNDTKKIEETISTLESSLGKKIEDIEDSVKDSLEFSLGKKIEDIEDSVKDSLESSLGKTIEEINSTIEETLEGTVSDTK